MNPREKVEMLDLDKHVIRIAPVLRTVDAPTGHITYELGTLLLPSAEKLSTYYFGLEDPNQYDFRRQCL